MHAHGWRWNRDGVWTRLSVGDTDSATGSTYTGPPREAGLARGERMIVDEAGMLDQDTAHALLTITAEAGATVALVGDRAQLPAVGRGGVLDMAAQIRGRTYEITELHRFADPAYAALTLALRDRENLGAVFDRLSAMNLVTLHADGEQAREHITAHAHSEEAITVATNDEATALNERIRTGRVERGEVDDTTTATGSDGLAIGPVTSSRPARTAATWAWRTGSSGSCSASPTRAPCTREMSSAGARTPAPSPCLPSMWPRTRTCLTQLPPTASKAQPSIVHTRSCRRRRVQRVSMSA